MNRRACVTFTGALLILGIGSLAVYSADDDDKAAIKAARTDVLKMVDAMNSGKDVKGDAAAIRKKNEELGTVMKAAFKPRSKGGIGLGPKGTSDGIELQIGKIANPKNKFTAAQLNDLKADLLRGAQVSKAVADITDLYVPKKMPDAWKKHNANMKKGADDLIAAVNSGDPMKVKKAATTLNASCTDCHSDFRND
jgi:cytochrome c556